MSQTLPVIPDSKPTSDYSDAPLAIGEAAGWFQFKSQGHDIVVCPEQPLPRRCTIRPAALFDHEFGFPDIKTVMGRLVFPRGAVESQIYRPFTRDEKRTLRELYFPVEPMPDDDWPVSGKRWSNYMAISRCLLKAAGIPWTGLTPQDVSELVEFVPWPEPVEGCVLHALAQWSHERGRCIIEIGSFRGRSLTMLAMALRGVDSDSLLLSIDPHDSYPINADHCRLALRQIGEEDRLVQIRCSSDRAHTILRPESASMVFVDGDHAYHAVLNDFRHYSSLLAPGGVLAFHDYGYGDHNGLPEADPEVRRAVDEHAMACPAFRPLLLAQTLMAFVKR